jgi:hypothetical protein
MNACASTEVEVEVEALGQSLYNGPVDPATKVAEKAQILLAGQVRIGNELTEEATDVPLCRFQVAYRVGPEDLRAPGGRAQ